MEAGRQSRLVRFGVFEADLQAGELRKAGAKLKLSGQPFQVLTILLEHPGEVVTREELQKRLWPDTFVDVDHNLNTAINKIREVLADSAESPRYVETLPRRGYRFIAPVESDRPDATSVRKDTIQKGGWRAKALHFGLLSSAVILLASAGVFLYKRLQTPVPQAQRTLTRVTFDDGLQIGVTWSPDSRFIAYSSDHGGKFDIWVQQISGGDPLQITKGAGNNWQPDWSPDGKWIAYRSEDGEGGLYMIPALGGAGLVRKVTTFGYYPRWSPDSSKILFQTSPFRVETRFYLATLDGNPPHEILAGLSALYRISPISATWHPDGKRVTVWLWGQAPSPNFLTAPVAGGTAVRSEIAPAIARQLGEISGNQLTWIFSGYADLKFSWAPSGRAIYFERTFRDARNFWKMSIDPETLRATAIERLTTGPGLDTEFAVSPDGKKIAFTEESRHIRGWLLPFDASRGQVLGPGQAVTSPGIEAWLLNLSRDGKKVAFVSNRAGIRQIEERALQAGPEAPVVADADAYSRTYPQWSPDGTRLVYFREAYSTGQGQLMLWSSHSRDEEPLTTPGRTSMVVYDWSPDGNWLIIGRGNEISGLRELWKLPVAAGPAAQAAAVKVAADPTGLVFQGHFSPDGQWIAFEGERSQPTGPQSILYVMRTDGGPWIPVTESKYWSDKPRWSPDGKIIYFLASRQGFLNVWGLHFDAAKGKAVGDPFPVTAFNNPSLMVPDNTQNLELSLTRDWLALTIAQVSGSIWVLGNVDQ